MRPTILNRTFQHPDDGWYQIEPKGDHPNRAKGIVQVIDDDAAISIVNRFNADAASGQLSHGHEMLIDHEHFKHQADKETIAYGWLQQLQNRADGIYGQVRWSATGKTSVDGGDYRFFSTEYDPADLKVLNDGKVKRVRPLKLDGLSLTNDPNNKGGKPITNRISRPSPAVPEDGCCPDCKCKLIGGSTSKLMSCPECNSHFVGSRESAGSEQTTTVVKNKKMKTVCTLLGLSADADETSVHAAVSKLLNRGDITPDALATLKNRATALETENLTLMGEQVEGILAEHGIKEEKVVNRLKPILTGLKNRADRVATLVDFGFKPVEAKATATTRVLNRGGGGAVPQTSVEQSDEATLKAQQVRATKVTNRAQALMKEIPHLGLATAFKMAGDEITE